MVSDSEDDENLQSLAKKRRTKSTPQKKATPPNTSPTPLPLKDPEVMAPPDTPVTQENIEEIIPSPIRPMV